MSVHSESAGFYPGHRILCELLFSSQTHRLGGILQELYVSRFSWICWFLVDEELVYFSFYSFGSLTEFCSIIPGDQIFDAACLKLRLLFGFWGASFRSHELLFASACLRLCHFWKFLRSHPNSLAYFHSSFVCCFLYQGLGKFFWQTWSLVQVPNLLEV